MLGNPSGGCITVAKGKHIRDGCIIIARDNRAAIGDNVTVGQCAQIHVSIMNGNCLVGMGSILQSGNDLAIFSFTTAGANDSSHQAKKSILLCMPLQN